MLFFQKKEISNTCHLTSLLLLKVSAAPKPNTCTLSCCRLITSVKFSYFNCVAKVTIYQHFECTGGEMSSLQQLCSLLPFNPWHWHSLGQMCVQLLKSKRTTSTLLPNSNMQGFFLNLCLIYCAVFDFCRFVFLTVGRNCGG